MDTDYLTEKAYETLISESNEISGFLCSDIGAMASEYPDEDVYLNGVVEYLDEIIEEPLAYLEGWNLEDEMEVVSFTQNVANLKQSILKVIAMPIKDRGESEFQ